MRLFYTVFPGHWWLSAGVYGSLLPSETLKSRTKSKTRLSLCYTRWQLSIPRNTHFNMNFSKLAVINDFYTNFPETLLSVRDQKSVSLTSSQLTSHSDAVMTRELGSIISRSYHRVQSVSPAGGNKPFLSLTPLARFRSGRADMGWCKSRR